MLLLIHLAALAVYLILAGRYDQTIYARLAAENYRRDPERIA